MSKFSVYANKVNEIAQTAFAEYKAAETRLKNAEAKAREYPQRHGAVDYEYVAKSARAQADLVEARSALHRAQMKMNDGMSAISAVRRELAAALNDEYAADPSALDSNTLELLKSGILTAKEFAKLMNSAAEAGNLTMTRIIGKYANAAADEAEKNGRGAQKAAEFRAVAYQGETDAVGGKLGLFDVMVETYRRTAGNPSMIGAWDELTGPAMEAL